METSISLAEQVKFFADTKLQMTQYARGKDSGAALDELLAESLFLISAGGNDFFLHIANPDSSDSIFQENLLSNFTKHVQTLYDLGARRFGIVGVPPVGCVPAVRVRVPFGLCLPHANKIVREFNSMVGEMMANFSTDPEQPGSGMTYSVGSSYNVLMNFTRDPTANGFTVVRRACCGDGLLGAENPCKHNSTVCRNRATHLYWDFAHSTQATAEKGAAIIFNAPVEENFTAPINFQQLVSPRQHGSGGFSSA
uniref:Uncharacterized protein n=1 Tax=Avena sativa TaxID=4498 RepID=A0ACD5W331_AVESA